METKMNQSEKIIIQTPLIQKVFLIFWTIFFFGLPFLIPEKNTILILVFIFFGLLSLLVVFTIFDSVTFDETSIEYKSPYKPSRPISWSEIQNIKPVVFGSAIQLMDGHGNKFMRISTNIKDSDKLVAILANKFPNMFVPEPNHVFRYNIILKIILVLFLVAIGGYLIYGFINEPYIFTLVVGLFCIGYGLHTLLFSPYETILKSDRLVIKSIVKTQEIPLANIANVEYEVYMVRYGTRYYRTTLTLVDGKQVPIAALGTGTLPAFLYIRSWWKEGQRSK